MAGLKQGEKDKRYLWPEFSRVVGELKPRWVVGENVPGIINLAADTVCKDLERQGYEVGIFDFEAAALGAPHKRERIFFVAHAGRSLRQRLNQQRNLREETKSRPAACSELSSSVPDRTGRQSQSGMGFLAHGLPAGLDGGELTFWEKVPEPAEKIAHGVKDRGARLKALGNAVVPQQAYPIFKAIIEEEKYYEQNIAPSMGTAHT